MNAMSERFAWVRASCQRSCCTAATPKVLLWKNGITS